MNLRKIALQAFADIVDHDAYANLRLKQLPDSLSERDTSWITALVYTSLDHLLTIDYYLAAFVSQPTKPVIRNVLRLGTCELLFFGTPSHAAISEYVQLTRQLGKGALSGFVNAVLRKVDRERDQLPTLPSDPIARLSIRFSYPEWLIQEWVLQYGLDWTERLLSSPPAPMEIRAQFPCTTEQLLSLIPAAGVSRGKLDANCLLLKEGMDVAALPAFQQGLLTVQSQSAMLVCRALGDCRGKQVLDVCAAPGGKSAYLASLCENDIDLTCFELYEHRKQLIDRTFARLHVSAKVLCRDACVPEMDLSNHFDAVLIDAPCSGLGLLHDKPDIRYRKSDADIDALAQVQKELLHVNAAYVRPGGYLLYATCTISRRENEDQTANFLAAHPDFSLDPLPIPLSNAGMLQLLPHVHGCDGFFMARFKKHA